MLNKSLLFQALAAAALAGCGTPDATSIEPAASESAQPPPVSDTERELPEGSLFSAELTAEGPRQATIHLGAAHEVKEAQDSAPPKQQEGQARQASADPKILPGLRDQAGPIEVFVELHDNYKLPRLPRLGLHETRQSPTWAEKSQVIEQQIATARAARNSSQERVTRMLSAGDGKILSQSWLVNGFVATIDPSQLATLEADPQVKQVSPSQGGHLLAEIQAGRYAMNSDPYFNTPGLAGGWIGLLDSGVRTSHQSLAGQTTWVRDCINGHKNACATPGMGLTLDPSDTRGHGTAVGSVISGTNSLGADKRGVTDINLDSFKVVVPQGAIDYGAVIRGFEAAVAGGDDVVNASFDCYSSVCTTAANSAFDAGLVVVAAAGNTGNSNENHIGDPASGKKVLAVGSIDPTDWTRLPYSATGPSTSGQTKPDLMAVSGSWADLLQVASIASDSAFAGANGTSLSSPFVAGGAGLMRRWLNVAFGTTFASEPGQTNAMLIAAGTNYGYAAKDSSTGAGRLALPTDATLYGGKVGVGQGTILDVDIGVAPGFSSLDAAIWWPEGTIHNDVDLILIRPDGSVAATSVSVDSVWEKVHVATSTPGTWKIRVRGYSVTGAQLVYFAGIRR